jgi:hypothetical protein
MLAYRKDVAVRILEPCHPVTWSANLTLPDYGRGARKLPEMAASARSSRGRASGAFRSGSIGGILTQGAESQVNRESVAFTPRQNECLVNVPRPRSLPRCVRQVAVSRADNALSGSLTTLLGSEAVSSLRFQTACTLQV